MKDRFIQRRHENPRYSISVVITGVAMPDRKIHWNVDVEGAKDNDEAAAILERAIEVLKGE